MKKKLYFMAALLSLAFLSCEKPTETTELSTFDQFGSTRSLFSVGDGARIRFSRGNLQYQASTGIWRFAENQYDYIGEENRNIAQGYDGWIDLFGWGTSGWYSGAGSYLPYDTSTYYYEYNLGPHTGLSGDYAQADWGVYNAICNGGNEAGMWRTLTADEWSYLMGDSGVRAGKWARAIIGGRYKGVVILPDEWTTPEGLTFAVREGAGYAENEYSEEEWALMEKAGAVFLPAAGSRRGIEVSEVQEWGNYHAVTSGSESQAMGMSFCDTMALVGYGYKHVGNSVRLVRDYRR